MERKDLTIKTLSLLLLLLPFCICAKSHATTNESIDKLVGTNKKTWIYQRFEKFMGNDKCKKGESWTIYREGHIVVKKCNGDVEDFTNKDWSIEQRTPIDVVMKVGGVEYFLLFPPIKPGSSWQSMILRRKAQSIDLPTQDMIFYYEVD